ncbi:major royal jelly protein [Rhizodiscina lignyota]|uniref:Major royal jelly protein n=1 Tax=Rhizodiscina lignyota TaxID=1504668 RepID=A0A9P4IJ50_9PEZI|nr:major royal jelly protein [Rhizodiscina lignyota]
MMFRFLLPIGIFMLANAAAQYLQIKNELTLETPCNGVSTLPDGRLFILYARVDGSHGPTVLEWKNGKGVPYPNLEWNSYSTDMKLDPASHFVRINSIRNGPDGSLWIVDTGSPSFGADVILPEGPKLIKINTKTNKVSRIYPMGNVTRYNSLLDDVRFHDAAGKAYLTDAGSPALIVLDLASGDAIRVLENDVSTSASMPTSGEGVLMGNINGGLQYIYADQLEVSPDGKWFYYQPASGGMHKIETKYLNNAFYNSSLAGILSQYVVPHALTPSTGGTAIDAEGNIYDSDTDRQAIMKIAPNGTMTTLIRDSRLLWVDAMWIDSKKRLWMPAAQLNRGEPFNKGKNHIKPPLHVYSMDIGVGPSPIDHA